MSLLHLSLRPATHSVPSPPTNDERAKAYAQAVSRARCVSGTYAYQRLLHRQESRQYAMEQSPLGDDEFQQGFDFKYGVAHDAG